MESKKSAETDFRTKPALGLRWPSLRLTLLYALYSVLVTGEFMLVYGLTNHWADSGAQLHRLYLDAELAIPLVPIFIIPYMSLNVLMLLALFVLDERELKSYVRALAMAIFAGGLVFWLFPGQLGFVRNNDATIFRPLYDALFSVDKPHNLVPSLHVALSSLTVFAMYRGRQRWLQNGLLIWLLLILLAVVLTHQHHLLDVLTGFGLAWACHRPAFAWRRG